MIDLALLSGTDRVCSYLLRRYGPPRAPSSQRRPVMMPIGHNSLECRLVWEALYQVTPPWQSMGDIMESAARFHQQLEVELLTIRTYAGLVGVDSTQVEHIIREALLIARTLGLDPVGYAKAHIDACSPRSGDIHAFACGLREMSVPPVERLQEMFAQIDSSPKPKEPTRLEPNTAGWQLRRARPRGRWCRR